MIGSIDFYFSVHKVWLNTKIDPGVYLFQEVGLFLTDHLAPTKPRFLEIQSLLAPEFFQQLEESHRLVTSGKKLQVTPDMRLYIKDELQRRRAANTLL